VATGNNRSCVVKIDDGEHSVLLTGDIEAQAELAMLSRHWRDLASTLIQVRIMAAIPLHRFPGTAYGWEHCAGISCALQRVAISVNKSVQALQKRGLYLA
jgi:hypothetical protein